MLVACVSIVSTFRASYDTKERKEEHDDEDRSLAVTQWTDANVIFVVDIQRLGLEHFADDGKQKQDGGHYCGQQRWRKRQTGYADDLG